MVFPFNIRCTSHTLSQVNSPGGLGQVCSQVAPLLGSFLLQDLGDELHAGQLLSQVRGAPLLQDVHHLPQLLQGRLLPLDLRVVEHWRERRRGNEGGRERRLNGGRQKGEGRGVREGEGKRERERR